MASTNGQPTEIPAERTMVTTTAGNSTFIALADCTATVAEARAFIAEQRRAYPDATHHCYAFAIGHGATVTHGSGDDGEPSGTAGRPILSVLGGSGLGDATVVVVRYFGGTKLGTGGLVRAYTDAAKAVLVACPRALKIARVTLSARVPYALFERVCRIAQDAGALASGDDYGADIGLSVVVEAAHADALIARVGDETTGIVRLS